MFHCIPFLAGAAAGTVITYVLKDHEARDRIRAGTDRVVDGVRDGFERAGRAGRALVRPASNRTGSDTGIDPQPATH
ncbi:hypothetical protein [Allochromatium vinosum]|uniref:hypothetical protein n=1 Tax=Allochromatium vinosum TaxID=1049 RepID=UPI0001A74573|nr:hypothetical protein [Allochromatium vinosum]